MAKILEGNSPGTLETIDPKRRAGEMSSLSFPLGAVPKKAAGTIGSGEIVERTGGSSTVALSIEIGRATNSLSMGIEVPVEIGIKRHMGALGTVVLSLAV
jgi:hypothetical protein